MQFAGCRFFRVGDVCQAICFSIGGFGIATTAEAMKFVNAHRNSAMVDDVQENECDCGKFGTVPAGALTEASPALPALSD